MLQVPQGAAGPPRSVGLATFPELVLGHSDTRREERVGVYSFTAGPGRAHRPGFLEPPGSLLFRQPLKCELF